MSRSAINRANATPLTRLHLAHLVRVVDRTGCVLPYMDEWEFRRKWGKDELPGERAYWRRAIAGERP